ARPSRSHAAPARSRDQAQTLQWCSRHPPTSGHGQEYESTAETAETAEMMMGRRRDREMGRGTLPHFLTPVSSHPSNSPLIPPILSAFSAVSAVKSSSSSSQ